MPLSPLPTESVLIRVNRVTCDEHGDVRPEGFIWPFTVQDAQMLGALPFACTRCVLEYGIEHALLYPPDVDWEPASAVLPQHWADIGHDPDATPQWYPIWEVRTTARSEFGDPVYRMGTRQHWESGPFDPEGPIV